MRDTESGGAEHDSGAPRTESVGNHTLTPSGNEGVLTDGGQPQKSTADRQNAATSQFDEERFEQAIENTQPIIEMGKGLADAAVADAAHDAGRTVEEQWERMGDGYAYQAVEMDPHQRQIDDYTISGDTVEVER